MIFAVRGEYPLTDDELFGLVAGYFEYYADFFGDYPKQRYLVMFNQGGGGGDVVTDSLSVVLSDKLANLSADEARQELFNDTMIPHEIFHIWNGADGMKAKEYVKGRWFSEGFTEYYAMLTAERLRPKKTSQERNAAKQFVTRVLNGYYHSYQQNPKVILEHGSGNEVYHKGALVALIFDMAIRKKTKDAKTLDDFMKAMYERFGRSKGREGYTNQDIFKVLSEFTGEDMTPFYEKYIAGNENLPVEDALAQMGYQVGKDGTLLTFGAEKEEAMATKPPVVDEKLRERFKFNPELLPLVDNETATYEKDGKQIRLKKWAYWEGTIYGADDLIFKDGVAEIKHLEYLPPTGVKYTFYNPLTKGAKVKVMPLLCWWDTSISQQPKAENNYSAVIHLNDWMSAGNLYQFILYYEIE
jgi:hypothetical protein